jgi:hypothetical protein
LDKRVWYQGHLVKYGEKYASCALISSSHDVSVLQELRAGEQTSAVGDLNGGVLAGAGGPKMRQLE